MSNIPEDTNDLVRHSFTVSLVVTAKDPDDAIEIFSKATGAQILNNCTRYKVEGYRRDIERRLRGKRELQKNA